MFVYQRVSLLISDWNWLVVQRNMGFRWISVSCWMLLVSNEHVKSYSHSQDTSSSLLCCRIISTQKTKVLEYSEADAKDRVLEDLLVSLYPHVNYGILFPNWPNHDPIFWHPVWSWNPATAKIQRREIPRKLIEGFTKALPQTCWNQQI